MAKKAGATCSGFDVLLDSSQAAPCPVCAIVGDGGFLQHEVRRTIVAKLTGSDPDATAAVLDGETALAREVFDALSVLSLFGNGRRVVVVEAADPFVQQYRDRLEDYVAKPRTDAVLVLEVASWPANTRLAKAVAESGLTIRCQTPSKGAELAKFTKQLKDWLVATADREWGAALGKSAVDELVDLLPLEPGVMYQEVARLALLAGASKKIDGKLVLENVGGWRVRTTWDMIDAAADGRASDALTQLDRLLAAGEDTQGVFPQMASSFRKFALATRLIDQAERRRQRPNLRAALELAGVPPFKLGDAERQLRQIGRLRARQLYRWLLAIDLELKGHNSSKERSRRVLETLIVRLSRECAASMTAEQKP